MVKLIEQVINIVMLNEPNRTDKLQPKGKEVGQRAFSSLCVDTNTSGGELEPNLSISQSGQQGNPVVRPKGQGNRKEAPWISGHRRRQKAKGIL